MKLVRHFGIYIAWLISLIGTFASLYVGEIHGAEPCSLCWYQRICLFPLVIILGYAAYRHFPGVVRYVIALPILGLIPAIYQLIAVLHPSDTQSCIGGATCTFLHGPIFQNPYTMPALSILAFILIIVFLLASKRTLSLDSNEKE